MSKSIDELRDAVIEAARRDYRRKSNESAEALHDAVAELRDAEKPDVWQLLHRCKPFIGRSETLRADVNAALAWRAENGGES